MKDQSWISSIEQYARADSLVVIVGTKCDLKTLDSAYKQEMEDYVSEINKTRNEANKVLLKFVSSKTGENVEELFEEIVTNLHKQEGVETDLINKARKEQHKNNFVEFFQLTPIQSTLKAVVFDWDNTLSDQAEIDKNERTLAFEQETISSLRKLSSLGVKIVIASKMTEEAVIINCLESYEILNTVHKVYGRGLHVEKIDVINQVQSEFNILNNNQICLVDDSKSACTVAREQGYRAIIAMVDNGLYVANPRHVLNTLRPSLDALLDATRSAIFRYQANRADHISFFSRIFDFTRGEVRANTYLRLLNDSEATPFGRMVIIYSMLASSDGERLQKCVYTQMGFQGLEQAKEYFREEIRSHLLELHKDHKLFDSTVDQLNENVIRKMVCFANSDKALDKATASNFFKELSIIENGTREESYLRAK